MAQGNSLDNLFSILGLREPVLLLVFFPPAHGLVILAMYGVRVDVGSNSRRGVSEPLRDYWKRHSTSEHLRCKSVPEQV
jgi:hypothetical protein